MASFDAASVEVACAAMAKAGLRPQVMIDFSHANSSKQHWRQIVVGQQPQTWSFLREN